ncbi:MAG: hypothetical protein IK141_05665 [Clostridia bacterium]|nr:hypothetical protein [Clostridia bacterium]
MNQTVWVSCALAAVTGAFGYFLKRLISGHDALRMDLEDEKKADGEGARPHPGKLSPLR